MFDEKTSWRSLLKNFFADGNLLYNILTTVAIFPESTGEIIIIKTIKSRFHSFTPQGWKIFQSWGTDQGIQN